VIKTPRGWRRRIYGYSTEEVDYERIKSEAKELLSKVAKGNSWRCGCGTLHIPLVVNGQIVGELWQDVDLGSIDIGSYWYSRKGRKVQLVSNKQVVGFLWLD